MKGDSYMRTLINELPISHISCKSAPDAEGGRSRLMSALRGGMYQFLVDDGDISLPHGVGDWTATHMVCPPTPTLNGESHPTPLFHVNPFHRETYQSGSVNWRSVDLCIQFTPPTFSQQAKSMEVDPAYRRPAYWVCPVPDEDNMILFNALMGTISKVHNYSTDNVRQPFISSLQPLLREGVHFILVRQHPQELVVLKPGVAHCVLTPPGAV